jgi:hypothetical protein
MQATLDILKEAGARLDEVETLSNYDGKSGYSLGQGR